jgi:c-di-GMP-binding flagellar brake protein YcgR
MEERRRFVRVPARAQLTYTVLPDTHSRQTVTKDVSRGGVACATDKPLPPGASLQVAMTLPGRDTPAHFIGEVVWSQTQETITRSSRERYAETGMRFSEIAPLDQDAVETLVARFLRPGL